MYFKRRILSLSDSPLQTIQQNLQTGFANIPNIIRVRRQLYGLELRAVDMAELLEIIEALLLPLHVAHLMDIADVGIDVQWVVVRVVDHNAHLDVGSNDQILLGHGVEGREEHHRPEDEPNQPNDATEAHKELNVEGCLHTDLLGTKEM